MLKAIKKRRQCQDDVRELRADIEKVKNDIELSEEGKKRKIEPLKQECQKKLQTLAADLQTEKDLHIKWLKTKKTEIDPDDVKMRAAIIGTALAMMDNDSMLNLYRARYNDPVERKLIEDFAYLRMDSAKQDGQAIKFAGELENIRVELDREQPGYEFEQQGNREIQYFDDAMKLVNYELQDFEGNDLDGAARVHKTNIEFEVNQFEAEYL